jgi:membrane protein
MSGATTRKQIDRGSEQLLRGLPGGLRRTVEILIQSVRDMLVDSGAQWAAALAYYTLLSAFPLMLVLGTVLTFFVDSSWAVERITSLLGDFVPEEGKIEDAVNQAIASRGQVGLIAFIGLIWGGTRVFGTLTRAMNVAFDADAPYGFFQRLLIETLMLLTIGGFFVLALASGALFDVLWQAPDEVPGSTRTLVVGAEWLLQFVLLLVAFFLIYRFVPNAKQDWRSALAGSAVATVLFIIASTVFQYYVARFGQYNVVYGSLTVVIIILIWIWFSSIIIIYGGEVAAHVQAMVFEGKSAEQVGNEHAERAPTRQERREAQ